MTTGPMLDRWDHRSIDGIIWYCQDLLEDNDLPTLQRWRDAGGKVLGHFQVYFPEEIAHAAGWLPFKVRGAPIEARHAEARFGSYLCSIIKTSHELALDGRLGLDMFVGTPICDSARNLAMVWGRSQDYPAEILYLPQNANSSHAAQYLRDEYLRTCRRIEELAGHPIGVEDLRKSIDVFNENRRLLRGLYEIKRDRPWLLGVDEAYALMAVGSMVPREEHNQLLRTVLPLIEERSGKPQDRMRLVFEGGFCEQPPFDLLRALARSTYVVDDDLLIGMRWILDDVPSDEPLLNLAEAYLESSAYSPVQHDLRKPKEKMLLDRVRAASASAVIIAAAKMCEPALDEQVAYAEALDEAGIPYFITEFEEGMTAFDHLEIQLETFVENLLLA